MSVFAEDTIMIHANSPNKDAAAEFLDWMVSDEAMSKKLEIDKPFPSNVNSDLSRLSEMEQRLGKAMAEVRLLYIHACRPRHATGDLGQVP